MKIQRFEFNMFGVNTYVVWDDATRIAAIIDPGMMTQRECQIIDHFVADNGLKVKHLINTHLHIDHAFGDSHVREQYDVRIEGHEYDNFLGESLESQARMFGLPVNAQPIEVEVPLKEGDTIMIGDEPLEVIHVPGHSPGSIALYAPESGFLISGDVLFAGSVGRTDLPGGNQRQLLDGIRAKLFTLPADTVVYPGHGPYTTIGDEIRSNPFFMS